MPFLSPCVIRESPALCEYVSLTFHFLLQKMYCSFFLVGVLALSAVRGFLVNLNKLFHAVYGGVPPAAAAVLLIQAMGMYLLSTVLFFRNAVPESFRKLITETAGSLHFDFYTKWFDALFIVSSLLSIVAIAAAALISAPQKPDD